MTWHEYFFSIVECIRQKSQDTPSKFGALIADQQHRILSTGYNGIPRRMEYRTEYHIRPDKYMYFVHAEQNAVFNAAALGVAIGGAVLYCIKHPCIECCKAIIQSGIAEVYYREDYSVEEIEAFGPDNWRAKMIAAHDMLHEASVHAALIKL